MDKKGVHSDSVETLQVGDRFGCFTVIAGFSAYWENCARPNIEKMEEERRKFIAGERNPLSNIDDVEYFDKWIEIEKHRELYQVQCKCGKTYYRNETFLKRKRWRYCGDSCDLKIKHEKDRIDQLPRKKSNSYDIKFVNDIFESYRIIECVDDHFEGPPMFFDRRRKGVGCVYLYKKFLCECYLCGQTKEYLSDQFEIKNDQYGLKARLGYYCDVFCDCHAISSFQWRTLKIFHEYGISYHVEESFRGLLGTQGKRLLRFDFAIFNPDGSLKCLVECQGEQHYKASPIFGGEQQFDLQQKNDIIKRQFAQENHIPLYEIPYTCDTYDKEVQFLKKVGLIDVENE